MSFSKMMADKMNLDLRHTILDLLEVIYFLSKKQMRKEGLNIFQKVKSDFKKLENRGFMIDSLSHLHGIDFNIIDFKESLEDIEKQDYNKAENKLSQLLFQLEEKFDESIQKGILER